MARPRNIEREEREGRAADDGPLFVTWADGDEAGRAKAMRESSRGMRGDEGLVLRSQAGSPSADGVTVRHAGRGADRRAYTRPRKPKDIHSACLNAYEEFGIVRNIHDTMADFATQGIGLTHPNPRINQFFQEWFYKVAGPEVSTMAALMLLLTSACPVRRHTARLKKKDAEDLRKGRAARAPEPPLVLGRREIPWRYTLLNPATMTVLGQDLAPFVGPDGFRYAVDVPAALSSRIKNPRKADDKALVEQLPEDVRRAIKKGSTYIPLDPDQLRVLHYKRFHWQTWATPMTYPLLDDLNMLRKLKMADMTALDGCISHIRLWRLGSLKDRMFPTKRAFERLAEMLSHAGNGVTFDLIWGPDLELQETSTDIHQFLGEGKYAPHLNAIYAGYGIPPTLTGAAASGGFTNNYISLKTMTERLAYVRRIVREFWEFEIALVQQAMGFRLPAVVRFDRMVLTDEAAEKALLIQLADRDLISLETLQERFGEDPLIEEVRQRAEARKREGGRLPKKASPWHDPQPENGLAKIFTQQGVLTPSQVGLDVPEPRPGEKTPLTHKAETAPAPTPPGRRDVGRPQQGRPLNSKDKKKRKQKRVTVRTKAALVEALAWAEDAQKAIADLMTPVYLRGVGKKNQRQLTNEESEHFERFKFALLCNCPFGEKVTAASAARLLDGPLPVPAAVDELLGTAAAKYAEREGGPPPLERVREMQRKAAALHKFDLGRR